MDAIKRSTGISGCYSKGIHHRNACFALVCHATNNGYLTFIYSPTMLIVRHATRLFSLSRATFNLMEECMYGLSLIRLGLFIALAI
ncbi:hypothetical protein, partial [Enterobacter hormaechei]